VTWRLVYTKAAQKDAKLLAAAGLKPKAQKLLAVLEHDPFTTPPRFERLVGDLRVLTRAGSTSSTGSSTRCLRRSGSSRCSGCGVTTSDAWL
jgi:hypothetical protein